MKTVSGKIVSGKLVNLSKAENILSNFVTSDNGASQSVSAYLRRASTAFNDLVYYHKHHKLKKHRRKEEASMKLDINPNKSEEYEIRVLKNGHGDMKIVQNPIGSDKKGTEKGEGKLREKEKKKKNTEGDLGSEKTGDIEGENEEKKDTKKERERESGEADDSVSSERKKKKRTESVD